MNRLLAALPVRPADPDAALLGRWAAVRDEAAFAELVRRHGPAVWAACRRQLANPADAEDAFQATFLVLARRADAARRVACLGAWLHRVAVLAGRNVRRRSRRKPSDALATDIPVSPADPAARLDADALLDRLPARDRRAVVLCHLYGFTRTEAAQQLGVPEGTLSAQLSRAMAKLRRAAGVTPAALAAGAVPAGLSAATVRAVGVWEVSAAGLSPVAAGAATGVLRMVWLKKLTAAAAAVVTVGLTTVGVGAGLASRPAAVAANPPPKAGGLPDGWKAEAELPLPNGKSAKLSARVEKGWVVAKYELPAGFKVWEVVLAQATGATPPAVTADKDAGSVAVEYGRYFARDAGGSSLRVLRQRKAADSPPRPAARPDGEVRLQGRSGTLYVLPAADWLWVACGPFGPDLEADRRDRADVCLRLSHFGHDSGTSGSGPLTATIGGVNAADYGDTRCTDDGELFVASYRPYPPADAPPKAKPPAPKPAAPPAKPTPPAAGLSKLPAEARKAFEELVPIAVTGTVRDADGNPVPNAEVGKHHTVGYAATFGQTRFNGWTRTDQDGRYTLWFRTQPDTTVVIRGLNAAADGFVEHREDFEFDQVKAHPDKPGVWDFVLAKGELLAGTVPAAAGKESVELLVRGPSYSRTVLLDDGKFRLWVPKGRYTLTAVLADERVARDKKLADTPEYSHGRVISKAAVLADVPSGSDNLVVK